MAGSETQDHLEKKKRAKAPEWLEVTRGDGEHPADNAHQEQKPCGGANGPFVEDGDVDALYFFAVRRGFSGRGHLPTLYQGGYMPQHSNPAELGLCA